MSYCGCRHPEIVAARNEASTQASEMTGHKLVGLGFLAGGLMAPGRVVRVRQFAGVVCRIDSRHRFDGHITIGCEGDQWRVTNTLLRSARSSFISTGSFADLHESL